MRQCFIEIQPYDSDHPIIINIGYIAKIEPTYYGSDIYLATEIGKMELVRCCTKYTHWTHCLNAM